MRYERRLLQSRQNPEGGWRPLHEGAKYNARNRRVKKMLAKTNWYKRKRDQGQDQKDSRGISVEEEGSSRKKRRKEDDENAKPDGGEEIPERKNKFEDGSYTESKGSENRISDRKGQPNKRVDRTYQVKKSKPDPPTISVMFVEQTVGGVLAKRLQEVEDRLAAITGYRVRITETSGSQLCRILPNTNPWGQGDCERVECYTCSQSGERLEDCKKRNILYESVCLVCNKEDTGGKFKSKWEEFKKMKGIYVGESARSLFERVGEHWQDVRSVNSESHMLKHWHDQHKDQEGAPRFCVRLVSSFGDALTRQISESVRIDLRGENVLNSRTEYSRCRIPRLTIDKEEWKKAKKKEIEVLDRDDEVHGDETEQGHQEAVAAGQEEVKRTQMKRKVSNETRASKRPRLETLVDWGEGEERVNLEMEGIQRWLGLSGGV